MDSDITKNLINILEFLIIENIMENWLIDLIKLDNLIFLN